MEGSIFLADEGGYLVRSSHGTCDYTGGSRGEAWNRAQQGNRTLSVRCQELRMRMTVDPDGDIRNGVATIYRTEPEERGRLRARARADVRALADRRAERRRAFLEAPGWTVVVEAESPLFPQGFDPLNVQVLSRGEVLHTRFLRLGSDRGTLEVLGRGALTESAGEHPLFNGVRRVVLTGFSDAPALARDGNTLRITADGLVLELAGAAVEREGRTMVVRLGG